MKMLKKILASIIILTMITYILSSILIQNKSLAVTQSTSTDINSIDSLKYPGVKEKIQALQKKYPNWKFKILYTGLDFNEVIANEYTGHGKSPKNLIYKSANYQGAWICSICKERIYDNGNWRCASEEAIKYMMDPRNSLNESDIFQFEELTKTETDINTIKNMTTGTFLAGYEQAIIDTSNSNNVNACYIVARLIQEQGKTGTVLTSGKGYNGQYVGYYNAFNRGASGNSTEAILLNGLATAQKYGWTSLEKSISGGIDFIANQYIHKGQNNLYLQKFDVEATNGLYSNQYMQNLMAAENEGLTLKNTYKNTNSMSSAHTFIIPVYENMPKADCARPSTNGTSNVTTDLVRVNVNSTIRLRDAVNGNNTVGWLYKDEIVTRLEKATTKVNGTYWDKIKKADGTTGYVARETYENESEYKLYLVPISEDSGNNNDNNNNSNNNNKPTNTSKVKIDEENKIIMVVPNAIANDILESFGGTAKITKADGNYLNGSQDTVATGYKVEDKYTVIKKGDCNGDGNVNTGDTYMLKCVVLNLKKFENENYKKAADVNNDNELNTGDTFLLKKQVLGLANIEL